MAYVIRYLTTVMDAPCSVTLRGLFEDGRYYGDVVIRNNFNFSIKGGQFNENDIKNIYQHISHLVSTEQVTSESSADFLIGQYPINSQVLLFKHYIDFEYGSNVTDSYMQLINLLKAEFDSLIQEKIKERQHEALQ